MTAESAIRIRDTPQGAVFEVHVHPRAKHTAITGILDGRVKLALASPPVDGRANEELQRFFAGLFKVPRSAVVLVAGEHTRDKRVLIAQQDGAAILAAIQQAFTASGAPSS
ncbi:MAG: DUF167 domain-containing protein [Acidobacteriaceae bacterium]